MHEEIGDCEAGTNSSGGESADRNTGSWETDEASVTVEVRRVSSSKGNCRIS
jgi:hypothetical protein